MACELCAAAEWNLCQLSVSEQGAMDSCQQQHTPGETEVGRQSWALKWKRTLFSLTPTSFCQVFIYMQTHTHRPLKVKKEKKQVSTFRGRFDLAPECLDYSQAAALNLTDFYNMGISPAHLPRVRKDQVRVWFKYHLSIWKKYTGYNKKQCSVRAWHGGNQPVVLLRCYWRQPSVCLHCCCFLGVLFIQNFVLLILNPLIVTYHYRLMTIRLDLLRMSLIAHQQAWIWRLTLIHV